MRKFVLSLIALIVFSAVANAGPIDNIRERREQRQERKHVTSKVAPCTFCNPCLCPVGNCPAKCPLVTNSVIVNQPCTDGKCNLKR